MNANPVTELRITSRSARARTYAGAVLWIAACLLLLMAIEQPMAVAAAVLTGLVAVALWTVGVVELRRIDAPSRYVLWLIRGGYLDPSGAITNKADPTAEDPVHFYNSGYQVLQEGGDYLAPLREGFRALNDSERLSIGSELRRTHRWRWVVFGVLLAGFALAAALTPK